MLHRQLLGFPLLVINLCGASLSYSFTKARLQVFRFSKYLLVSNFSSVENTNLKYLKFLENFFINLKKSDCLFINVNNRIYMTCSWSRVQLEVGPIWGMNCSKFVLVWVFCCKTNNQTSGYAARTSLSRSVSLSNSFFMTYGQIMPLLVSVRPVHKSCSFLK